jgi:hypothetical protein
MLGASIVSPISMPAPFQRGHRTDLAPETDSARSHPAWDSRSVVALARR